LVSAISRKYRIFGLVVSSELELYTLPALEPAGQIPDVEVRLRDWSELTSRLTLLDKRFTMLDGLLWFHVPETAVFSIGGGREIHIYPHPSGDEGKIRLYVLGTCMGALLMQRRIYPLHGSAVVIDGEAYAFVGETGAGKSTLAAAFLKRGYRLASDDVIAVYLDPAGKPTVMPAYPQQKLWQDSLEKLEMHAADHQQLVPEASKYAVSVQDRFHDAPVRLAGIYELIPTADCDRPVATSLGRLERLHAVLSHTYRGTLAGILGLAEWRFSMAAMIAGRTKVHRLYRPVHPFAAYRLVDLLVGPMEEVLTNRV